MFLRTLVVTTLTALLVATLSAQSPSTSVEYKILSQTRGWTLQLGARQFGPYDTAIDLYPSPHYKTVLFLAAKHGRNYVVVQGREFGPTPEGYSINQVHVSDDGAFWGLVLVAQDSQNEGSEEPMTLIWCAEKTYGPFGYVELVHAYQGGDWIAKGQGSGGTWTVLKSGKLVADVFAGSPEIWISARGERWGYAGFAPDTNLAILVDQDGRHENLIDYNVEGLTRSESLIDESSGPWAYAYHEGPESAHRPATIVVEGRRIDGLFGFANWVVGPSGRHWGFEATQLDEGSDYPVVVVDGQRYIGQHLFVFKDQGEDVFGWYVEEDGYTRIRTIRLP